MAPLSRAVVAAALAVPAQGMFLSKQGPEMSTAQQIVDAMWAGFESPAGSGGIPAERIVEAPASRNVQVFGLQNSGTFLMNTMLKKNLGNQLNYFNEGPDDDASNQRHGFWTHANIKEKWRLEREAFKILQDSDVYTIVMIRNPLSWIQAMRQQPQGFEHCVSGDAWVSAPCMHPTPGGSESLVPATNFSSLGAMWSSFNSGFHHSPDFGLKKHVVIPYESLIRNPQGVMDHIVSFLGLAKPAVGWAVPADTEASETSGRAGALRYTYRKNYMDGFDAAQKAKACSHLDKELQETFQYDDCSSNLHILTSVGMSVDESLHISSDDI